ncbi:MAG: hypothetical protein R3D27_06920 [Hyphomicrobiaceae bacterium]
MAKSESTSKTIASLASKAMKDPKSLSEAEIKRLAASALTQAPDKKPAAKSALANKAAAKAPAKKAKTA